MTTHRTAVIVIGRNEGARLEACLASLPKDLAGLVYVDSGSIDGSVAAARAAGARVVELDAAIPFTAARARNEGVAALAAAGHAPDYLQFIDGDCKLEQGYLCQAVSALQRSQDLALVTGWRTEIDPSASLFNAMCEHEWRGPVGEIMACGGDMTVRRSAFALVGGFNPVVIAAEDDEFCIRLRNAGWRLRRIPNIMTRHDANILQFSQWWRRAIRAGHGFEQVNDLHPEYFIRNRRRMWFYGAVLPLIGVLGILLYWPVVVLMLAIYLASYTSTAFGLYKSGFPRSRIFRAAFYLMLSKFPNIIGGTTYRARKCRSSAMKIIEYK